MTVSRKYNVSEATVWRWKKAFNWDERESVRAAEVNRKLESELNEQIVDFKAEYLKILNHLIFQAFESDDRNLQNTLKLTSMADLERAIKLALLIMGDSTERTEERVQYDRYPKDILREIAERVIRERQSRQDPGE